MTLGLQHWKDTFEGGVLADQGNTCGACEGFEGQALASKDQSTTSGCNSPEHITNGNVHLPQSQGISVIATLVSTDSVVDTSWKEDEPISSTPTPYDSQYLDNSQKLLIVLMRIRQGLTAHCRPTLCANIHMTSQRTGVIFHVEVRALFTANGGTRSVCYWCHVYIQVTYKALFAAGSRVSLGHR